MACSVEPSCPYSAPRLYRGLLDRGRASLAAERRHRRLHPAALDEALASGPYGRCVYACDNDVVDHQVVALEFAGGTTATFTMTAFTPGRRPPAPGCSAPAPSSTGDGETIRVYDFLTRAERTDHPGGRGRDERRRRATAAATRA